MGSDSDVPLVSIVTPSLNQAAYLEQTLESVAAQDYPALEHIVVDGGSTDGTLEILARHPGTRWVSEPDRGQSDAVNKGFRLANGAIFGWLNADDYYLPGAVSAAVRTLRATGAGLVYGGYRKVDDASGWSRDVRPEPFDARHQVEVGNRVPQPAAFFTREAFESAGGLDLDLHYAMDYDLWMKVGARCSVVNVDELWAVFRLHGDSKTVAQQERFWREERLVARRHGGRYLSAMLAAHVQADHPRLGSLLGRASRGEEMLRRREFRRLLSRTAATLVGR